MNRRQITFTAFALWVCWRGADWESGNGRWSGNLVTNCSDQMISLLMRATSVFYFPPPLIDFSELIYHSVCLPFELIDQSVL